MRPAPRDRRVEPADEKARPHLHHHAADENAGRDALFALTRIDTQTLDRERNYAHAIPHGLDLPLAYLAGKLIQHQFLPVVEEDVIDGTLAADHKAMF